LKTLIVIDHSAKRTVAIPCFIARLRRAQISVARQAIQNHGLLTGNIKNLCALFDICFVNCFVMQCNRHQL